MRVKASTILRACRDRRYEDRFRRRYIRAGLPPLEVIWDVPQTAENVKLVREFLFDYSPEYNPFARLLQGWLRRNDEGSRS